MEYERISAIGFFDQDITVDEWLNDDFLAPGNRDFLADRINFRANSAEMLDEFFNEDDE
jgi:hypothetical protein